MLLQRAQYPLLLWQLATSVGSTALALGAMLRILLAFLNASFGSALCSQLVKAR